ncbi:MAG: hypothetical protein EB060_06995 [Proteobacteria bacterium]|nr:hypothetical protein [Pseudomonadota bacterium]
MRISPLHNLILFVLVALVMPLSALAVPPPQKGQDKAVCDIKATVQSFGEADGMEPGPTGQKGWGGVITVHQIMPVAGLEPEATQYCSDKYKEVNFHLCDGTKMELKKHDTISAKMRMYGYCLYDVKVIKD